MPYKLYADGALIKQDVLDDSGTVQVPHSPVVKLYKLEMANGVEYKMPMVSEYSNPKQGDPANKGFLKHEPGPPAQDTGATPTGKSLRERYNGIFGS